VIAHTPKPLRILAIVNLPWDRRLGAARVWIELTEEWRKAGHSVEKFCLTDAFPKPTTSRALSAVRQAVFPLRAKRFVQKNAQRFDIIDCLIGSLPYSKQSLGFEGLIVARSIGLYRSYERFDAMARERWPDQPKGRLFGSLFHDLRARRLRRDAETAIRLCDLLNLPNESELKELERNVRIGRTVLVEPYGLSDQHRSALAHAAQSATARLQKKKICFVGMWSLRKGARDWPEIIRAIRAEIPEVSFIFLGTMFSDDIVRAALGPQNSERVQCVTTYEPAELPRLLADCTVGLFPSYIEGFGLAVLEQLAARIPTIAYDVPGPAQILHPQRDLLLTRAGDTNTMAERALQILNLASDSYEQLSSQCAAIADNYYWSDIAANTLRKYQDALDQLMRVTKVSN
jgi:glycosyltransferase involved in cell wall biosynthesis